MARNKDHSYIKSRLPSLDSQLNLVHSPVKSVDIVRAVRKIVSEERNKVKVCPCCDNTVADKKITFNKLTALRMKAVYEWCKAQGVHEYKTKEISHLLGGGSAGVYANIGYWVYFGGLFYKPEGKKKGYWGINLERMAEFIDGRRTAPQQIIIHGITGEVLAKSEQFFHEFVELEDMKDADGDYDPHKTLDDSTAPETELPKVSAYEAQQV